MWDISLTSCERVPKLIHLDGALLSTSVVKTIGVVSNKYYLKYSAFLVSMGVRNGFALLDGYTVGFDYPTTVIIQRAGTQI